MRDVRRVLVAIDLHRGGATLTAGSCFATDQAIELAKHLSAEVVLLHADRRPSGEDAAERTLEEVADRFRGIGVAATVARSEEAPALAIVHRVQRDRIDLVFAGRRNERSQAPMRLGSVSSELVRTCPCAVWITKPGGDLAPQRVLAASDLSAVGERVIEYAAFLADHYDAELHVAHAFHDRAGAGRAREEHARRLAAQATRARGAAAAIHAVRGAPADVVLELSQQLKPDLVVMGTRSHGRLKSQLLGSTALRLIGQLDCSLLTIKPEDFVCPVAAES